MATVASALPYGRHLIEEDDISAVVEVLRGDWLTTGPAVERFEVGLAEATGARHAVACANGTAALHLAALALELGPGDAAVVPAITFVATANAVRLVGAEVVFADVDPDTGLMRPEDLEAALARADRPVRAVLPVHLAGQTADMAAIGALARARGLRVVEDACHAIGGVDPEGAPVGACRHGDAATFSFHPVKTIAMGEGGAVTTNDDALAARVRSMRNHGLTRDPARWSQADEGFGPQGQANPWYYEMPEPGLNYRASDINCALAASQLGKLDRFAARRRALVERYDALVANLAPAVRPLGRVSGCVPAWHLYVVLVDFDAAGVDRGTVMRRLGERGIGSQVHYIPVHRQPYYRARVGQLRLPGADAYYARTLTLPLFPAMMDEDVERVVTSLAEAAGLR